jgi:hypothetical protein
MTRGRVLGLLALLGALSLTGCRSYCEHFFPAQNGCCCTPPPCCSPCSNYPVQAQPCAPAAPGWNVPSHQ